MINENWREWFQPWILERGKDYWKNGYVTRLCRDLDTITAIVQGTEDYEVEIDMDGDGVMAVSCTCPYAEDGMECKHMAAVLFAAEAEKLEIDMNRILKEKMCPGYGWQETIDQMSPEEMREFLTELVGKNKDLQEMLVLRYREQDADMLVASWEDRIAAIVRRYASHSGYIYYTHAADFHLALMEFLNDRLSALLKEERTMDAFRLVSLVYSTAMEQGAEDTDDLLSELTDECEAAWIDILEQATQAQEEEIYKWFADHSEISWWSYGTDQVRGFLFFYEWSQPLLENNLRLLDKRIEKYQDQEYRLEGLLKCQETTMCKLGCPEEEIEAFWNAYCDREFVRDRKLEQFMAAYDYDRAIALLLEGKRLDHDKAWRVKQHSEKLIELYRITGREEDYREELQYQVFSCLQNDLRFIRELRSVTSDEEWPKYLEELLKKYTRSALYYELLAYDKQWQRLFETIKAEGNLNRLHQYANGLRQWSPEQVRDCYTELLQKAMHYASNRQAYEAVISYLKVLKTYPEGDKSVQMLVTLWRKQFSRRSAMMDELRKAGV